MRTIETKVFEYNELNDDAKETARELCRSFAVNDSYWYDFIHDDFAIILKLMGIEVGKARGTKSTPAVYFSGFWSQGDGASFAGDFSYRKGSVDAVKAHAPVDAELRRIAQALEDEHKKHDYQATGAITQGGMYCHEMTMRAEAFNGEGDGIDAGGFLECFRDLARWLYRTLEKEYDWQTSDEAVVDMIKANGYEFTEAGKMV